MSVEDRLRIGRAWGSRITPHSMNWLLGSLCHCTSFLTRSIAPGRFDLCQQFGFLQSPFRGPWILVVSDLWQELGTKHMSHCVDGILGAHEIRRRAIYEFGSPYFCGVACYMLDFLKYRIAVKILGANIQVSSSMFPFRLAGK